MKKIVSFIFMAAILVGFTSCHFVTPNAEEEAALVAQPWFFGRGGVKENAVPTGLKWVRWTVHPVYFKIVPVRYDENFDDIFSNDNTPLDFNSYINIQIKEGKSPVLLKNYGRDWYLNNIQVFYRNKTREYVSMYSPFDLISNREVLNEIDSLIMKDMVAYVSYLSSEKELPIIIKSVTTGAARPNKEQMDEMNETARQVQQKQTNIRKEEAENARRAAEEAKARADKAYRMEMGLTPDQYIEMKYIEMINNKESANIDVLIGGGATQMWNIRR